MSATISSLSLGFIENAGARAHLNDRDQRELPLTNSLLRSS
jgi:hypothetical protein